MKFFPISNSEEDYTYLMQSPQNEEPVPISSEKVLIKFIFVNTWASTCKNEVGISSVVLVPQSVVEVSVAFKFFIETGLLALCSNPQPGEPCLHIYIPWRLGGPVIPPGTEYPF
jgi:hypothetical protein